MTPPPVIVAGGDVSAVGETRRQARRLAGRLGLGEEDAGRVALVATELAGNLWKHAGGDGWCQLEAIERDGARCVRLVVVDRGPGIAQVASALRDGWSTRGTPGTGLGAVRRLSRDFDLHTVPGEGTVVVAEVGDAPPAAGFAHGGVGLAKSGEERSGDAWAVEEAPGKLWVLVADGLGHGPLAAEAADVAVAAFRALPGRPPGERIEAIHRRLHVSRGAAVAVAEVDAGAGVLRYAGIGNVAGALLGGEAPRSLLSMNGTAGHQARTLRQLDYPWTPRSLLVMHSDGISARWDLASRPGLQERRPSTIAAVLVRDFGRGRDDAAAVVARSAG